MSNVDLDRLDALFAGATKGEWTVEIEEYGNSGTVTMPEINRILHDTEWADPQDFQLDQDNAEWMAESHNAYPAIAAELRTLRARVAELEEDAAITSTWKCVASRISAERDRLRAERDAAQVEAAGLREALEKIHKGACLTAQDSKSRDDDRYCLADVIQVSRSALARTPSQHRDRIVAEGLREAKEAIKNAGKHESCAVLSAMIERLEKEAGNGA